MPCVRAMATSNARPALASQAEKARRIIADIAKFVELNSKVQIDKAIKSDNIIPSKQRRAERR